MATACAGRRRMRLRRRAGREDRRGGAGLCGARRRAPRSPRPTSIAHCRERARRLQGAEAGRLPRRAAEVERRQDPARANCARWPEEGAMPHPQATAPRRCSDFVGHDFGASAPVTVGQDRIDGFADVTGDHQWIHVDVERAGAESPFGGPVAHGFLTLSLLAAAVTEAGVVPADAKGVINYGLDKIRFLAPVPAGARGHLRLQARRGRGQGRRPPAPPPRGGGAGRGRGRSPRSWARSSPWSSDEREERKMTETARRDRRRPRAVDDASSIRRGARASRTKAWAQSLAAGQEMLPQPDGRAPRSSRTKGDKRFRDPVWTSNPAYRALMQSYLAWSNARRPAGWTASTCRRATSCARKLVTGLVTDALAPTNALLGNPAAMKATLDTGGRNLVAGPAALHRAT